MFFDTQHLIIGIKLITIEGEELELRTSNDWRLAIWDENGHPESGREIGVGALLEREDPAFFAPSREPTRASPADAEMI